MGQKGLGLKIRLGTPEDYPAALAIQRRAYELKEAPLYGQNIPPMQETPETLAAEIAGGKQLLVCECCGRLTASLRMRVREDGSVYFGRLSVDPDLQGMGIGQKMTLAVEEFNPEATEFYLDCGERSDENRHIYGKLGYQVTGREHDVPGGPHCVEMKKTRVLQQA